MDTYRQERLRLEAEMAARLYLGSVWRLHKGYDFDDDTAILLIREFSVGVIEEAIAAYAKEKNDHTNWIPISWRLQEIAREHQRSYPWPDLEGRRDGISS